MLETKVRVETNSGYLRFRFTVSGERYCFSPGLKDNPHNRARAIINAADLERRLISDIADGVFDPTLEKYKKGPTKSSLKTYELFDQFIQYKKNILYEESLIKYKATSSLLRQFFAEKTASSVNEDQALRFRNWYAEKVTPGTLRERVKLISLCWQFGIERKLVESNPWTTPAKIPLRVQKEQPKPFTDQEIRLITQGFRTSRYYSVYSDFVEFQLGTGARPGETIALTWGDVSEDCSQVWFGKSFSGGVLKPTKNHQAGFVKLSPTLQRLLIRRRPATPAKEDLIFPAIKGGYMHLKDFRIRAWRTILNEAGVEYRPPYNCRSSLITYWLKQGKDPLTVAKYTRTSAKTIYEHYAGYLPSDVALPEIPGLEGYTEDTAWYDEDDDD